VFEKDSTSDVPIIAKSPSSVRKIKLDAPIDCCMDESDVAVIRIFTVPKGNHQNRKNDRQRPGCNSDIFTVPKGNNPNR